MQLCLCACAVNLGDSKQNAADGIAISNQVTHGLRSQADQEAGEKPKKPKVTGTSKKGKGKLKGRAGVKKH